MSHRPKRLALNRLFSVVFTHNLAKLGHTFTILALLRRAFIFFIFLYLSLILSPSYFFFLMFLVFRHRLTFFLSLSFQSITVLNLSLIFPRNLTEKHLPHVTWSRLRVNSTTNRLVRSPFVQYGMGFSGHDCRGWVAENIYRRLW